MTWYWVDLGGAYADLLGRIKRRTGWPHRAYDVLHNSLIRLALATAREPIAQPHAYLRTVVRSVLTDHYRDDARWAALPDSDDQVDEDKFAGHAPSAERMAQSPEVVSTSRPSAVSVLFSSSLPSSPATTLPGGGFLLSCRRAFLGLIR